MPRWQSRLTALSDAIASGVDAAESGCSAAQLTRKSFHFHPALNFSFQTKQKDKKTECASFDRDHFSLDSVLTQLCAHPENGLTLFLLISSFFSPQPTTTR